MTTLITGGAGFVGLNLAEFLLAREQTVVLFDNQAPPTAFLSAIAGSPENLQWCEGDVRDKDAVRRAFGQGTIDRVFHGAAITAGADRERSAPDLILDVNLTGTLRLLEAARDNGVRRLVFPSSLLVYGESLYNRQEADEELTPPVPESLYGITKYAAERLVLRFGSLHGLDVVCGRVGSVFGPWEMQSGVRDLLSPFWQATDLALKGVEIVLPAVPLGRELTYSRDLAAALARLLEAPKHDFKVYNIAGTDDWSDTLTEWCGCLVAALPNASWRNARPGETPNVTYGDERARARQATSRLRDALGFAPLFGARGALKDYLGWVLGTR